MTLNSVLMSSPGAARELLDKYQHMKISPDTMTKVGVKEIKQTPAEQAAAAAKQKADIAAMNRRFVEAEERTKIKESDALCLPNISTLDKSTAKTVRDCLSYYERQPPSSMTVYAANGNDKTSSLATYRKWLDAII